MSVQILGGVNLIGPQNWMSGNDFNRKLFESALLDKGYSVLWERAAFCPNRTQRMPAPREHDIACTMCDGSGFIYFNPIETTFLLTSISMAQSYYSQGRWDSGQTMVTGLPEQMIHPNDRITVRNGLGSFQELVMRTKGTRIDKLKYQATCVDYLSWKNRDGQLVVFQNEYTLLPDGTIRWADGEGPDDGDIYSIVYGYHPRYIVQNLVHHHRESTVKGQHKAFPVQAIAKLDYLVRAETTDEGQVQYENPLSG